MDTNKETNTVVDTKVWDGNFADFKNAVDSMNEPIKVECPIFIIFAEYFGYISKFAKICEDWCDGKVPDIHVQKFLMVEASSIFHQMKIDYKMEEIKYYYSKFYPLVLEEYCDKLANICK